MKPISDNIKEIRMFERKVLDRCKDKVIKFRVLWKQKKNKDVKNMLRQFWFSSLRTPLPSFVVYASRTGTHCSNLLDCLRRQRSKKCNWQLFYDRIYVCAVVVQVNVIYLSI